MLSKMVIGLANLTLAWQKYQDVASSMAGPKFIHRLGNGIVQIAVTRFLKGTPPHFNRESASRHHDDRGRTFAGSKVLRKTICVDGGRRHDHFQVGTTGQDLAQVAQQEINVQAAFVRFIDDDCVVGFEQRVVLRLGQQNAVSHQFD